MKNLNRRILYLNSSRDPGTAGLSAAAYYAALPYGHGAVLYHLEQLGWNVVRIPFFPVAGLAAFGCRLRSPAPDIIMANSVAGVVPWFFRLPTKPRRPFVVHTWDDFYEDIWRANYGRLAGWFMRWLERRIVVGSDYIITISRHNQRRAEGWGKKAWYIPNGCDVPVFDATRCAMRLEGALKLVYCGDQGAYKRTGDIIAAMAHVPADVRLYMVGSPNPALRAVAPANVIFLGRVPENDKWAIMSQADVLVCTADTDCNAKFHEYLRMGKPILGYDGIPNCLFTNRRNALLTRDYPAAIRELQQSPDLRRTLAENAARDIPVYTWREIAAQYDGAFEEILSGKYSGGCAPAGLGHVPHKTAGP